METFERLPTELWERILAHAESSSDILHAMQTCRHLYCAGIRILYEHLKWQHPQRSAQNLQAWQLLENQTHLQTSLFEVPRSLTIAHHDGFVPRYDENDRQNETPSALRSSIEELENPFSISRALMGHRISSFSGLSSLLLFDSTIPESVYLSIFSLPNLRCLRIEYCTLPPISALNLHLFINLPIKELTLCGVNSDRRTQQLPDHLPPIFLSIASSLQSLTVDWTCDAAAFFVHHSPYTDYSYSLSHNISEVKIIMPYECAWPEDPDDMYLVYIAPLIQFLEDTSSITRLSIVGQLPNFFVTTDILPNIESYSGPINLFSKLPRRRFKHLDFTDPLFLDHHTFLKHIPITHPKLCSLGFISHEWNDDILKVISQFTLPQLSELSITYECCDSSERDIALRAWKPLSPSFPQLRTLRIYKDAIPPRFTRETFWQEFIRDTKCAVITPGAGYEEGSREHPVPENPNEDDCLSTLLGTHLQLREIQFENGFIWRRCIDGGWTHVKLRKQLDITKAMLRRWCLGVSL